MLLTIALFVAIYTVMFIIEMVLMRKAILKGPHEESEPHLQAYTKKFVDVYSAK